MSPRVEIDPPLLGRLRDARIVAVLTGAGVSAESGISTFRGPDGTWGKFDIRKLATPEGFAADPHLVWQWYQARQRDIREAQPNEAHKTLVRMEEHYPSFHLITQNIDGMHKRAGSRNVIELHGNIWGVRCTRDGAKSSIDSPVEEIPPLCECGSILRPDVVWFGEQLPGPEVSQASEVAAGCDVMFVVGTSAVVYPAAALPMIAKNSGACVVEVNTEPTEVSWYADASFIGPAGTILPEIWHLIK